MVVVRMSGGLGNQLFEYAAGRHLALLTGADLLLDLSSYRQDKLRAYRLGNFCISAKTTDGAGLPRSLVAPRIQARALLHGLYSLNPGYPWERLVEQNGPWPPPLKKANLFLDGYWQSERYFRSSRAVLLHEVTLHAPFSPENEAVAAAMRATNAVSLHVRRTDYVANPKTNAYHGVCSPDYYRQAVEIVQQRYAEPHFFVFSDDVPWVKANLPLNAPTVYIENQAPNQDCQELILMSRCRAHVIANSSFSWWGAWLNPDPDKLVVAPRAWFATQRNSGTGIVPPEWTAI